MKKILIVILLIFIVSVLSAKSKWLGEDKILHFAGSTFLTYWNYGVNKDILEQNSQESVHFAISFTFALGIAKEYSDKKLKKTDFSWHDLVYDSASVIAGLVLINNLR